MKKYLFSLIVTLIIIFPLNVFALSLKCEEGEYEYGEDFKCSLVGEANVTYKELTAQVEENDYLSCQLYQYADGLLSNMNEIKTSGTVTGEGEVTYIDFKCKVKTKTDAELTETQMILKNVKYTNTEDQTSNPEILRGNVVKVKKYVDKSEITTTDGKPRSVSNGNSLLKKLSDEELDKYFTFSKFVPTYNFEVPYDVDSINLTYETNVEGADVRIEGSNKLEVGKNVIDIYVTSPDLTSQTCYTLEIERLARGEEIYYPERDATLKRLSVKNYALTPNFESIIDSYTIKVDSIVNQVEITAIPNVEGASFKIEGNEDLKNKSTITVTVTSKDNNTTKTYSILVVKEKEDVDYSSYIYLGVIVGVLLIFIVFIVRSSNKRNSEVEKDMARFTKLFNKKKKENSQANIPEVTAGGTTAMPAQVVEPVQPVQPVQPVAPVVPQQPVQPVQPVAQAPVAPAIPVAPEVAPVAPAPVQPVQPAQTVQPVQPVAPVVPQQPVVPTAPTETLQPIQQDTNNQG